MSNNKRKPHTIDVIDGLSLLAFTANDEARNIIRSAILEIRTLRGEVQKLRNQVEALQAIRDEQ